MGRTAKKRAKATIPVKSRSLFAEYDDMAGLGASKPVFFHVLEKNVQEISKDNRKKRTIMDDLKQFSEIQQSLMPKYLQS